MSSDLVISVYGAPSAFDFAATPAIDYEAPDSNGNFILNWNAANFATNYNIYCDRVLVASGIPSSQTTYPITGKPTGTYTYVIEAVNPYGTVNSMTNLVIEVKTPILSPLHIAIICIIGAVIVVAVAVVSRRAKQKKEGTRSKSEE